MDPEIEQALARWWEAMRRVKRAEWTAGYSAAARKDSHAAIIHAKAQAEDEMYDLIETHLPPMRETVQPPDPDWDEDYQEPPCA